MDKKYGKLGLALVEGLDILKATADILDLILLKGTLVLEYGLNGLMNKVRSIMKEWNVNIEVILDTRTTMDIEIEDVVNLLDIMYRCNVNNITLFPYPFSYTFLKEFMKLSKLNVFLIVDVGTEAFRRTIQDSEVKKMALIAKEAGCKGVIMSSLWTDRIKIVREAIGENITIISMVDEGAKVGNAVAVSADFEVVYDYKYKDDTRRKLQAVKSQLQVIKH